MNRYHRVEKIDLIMLMNDLTMVERFAFDMLTYQH